MEEPKSAAGDPYDKSFIQPSMEKFEDFDQVFEKVIHNSWSKAKLASKSNIWYE